MPTATDDGNPVAYLAEDSDYDDVQAIPAALQRPLAIAGYDDTGAAFSKCSSTAAIAATELVSGIDTQACEANALRDVLGTSLKTRRVPGCLVSITADARG